MASVQFYGIPDVMQAAENKGCVAWAIFINRALFHKYQGENMDDSLSMLRETLVMLSGSESVGIYMIKFFENEPGQKLKITEKSVCDGGSFYFKLMDQEERQSRFIGAARESSFKPLIDQMQKDMQEMKQLILQKHIEDDEDDEPETIGSVMIDALKNPDKMFNLINMGRMILGLPVQNAPAVIGGIPAAAEMNKEDQLQRLGNAIDILEKNDPKIVEHLEKLAKIATDQPATFNMLISMLEQK